MLHVGYLDYVWVDSKLISISFTSDELNQTVKYLYNDFDEPVGFVSTREDGSVDTYYYLKNAQGDITHIVSAAGKKMVSFTYDAWGKRTVEYHANGSTIPGQIELITQMKADLLNPFAYRGYCYDYDMGMYYLQSRYYDPEVGRFINADDTNYLNATGTVLGCNLFAYCENCPVNRIDPRGTAYYQYSSIYLYLGNDSYFITTSYEYVDNYNRITTLASMFFCLTKGIVTISSNVPELGRIIRNKKTSWLASMVIYCSRYLDSNNLSGRTLKGVQFEILVHYIIYVGLKDRKTKTKTEKDDYNKVRYIDIGGVANGYGYDYNAYKFEKYKYLESIRVRFYD